MHKSIKIALAILCSILALAAIGAWYAISSINPAQLTQLLSSSVRDATGRDLKIIGPVSLSIFPVITVNAEQVSLSNASWASDPEMLTLKSIGLEMKWLPLLTKNVEISSIRLNGLEAYLQVSKAGIGNWDMSVPQTQAPGSSAAASASNSSPSDDSNFVGIETINITDARVTYRDGTKLAKVVVLPKLEFNGGGGKTSVLIDLAYANYKLGLKGKISSLRQSIIDWDQKPVKMDLDLVFTSNGKALDISGVIDKKPKTLPQFDIKLQSKSFDLLPLAGASMAASGANGSKPTSKADGKYVFSDDALPFDLIPEASGNIAINIAQLTLPEGVPLTNLKTNLLFDGDKLDVNDLSFELGKGSAQMQASLSGIYSSAPSLSMKGLAKGFTMEQIIASADASAKVSGGDTQIALNLRSNGASLHQLAARANGAMQISMGQGKLDSKFLNAGGDFVMTVLDAVNPMRKKTSQTVIECAVAYLPMSNGMVNIKDSVGVETDRLNIVLSGSINLNTEAINLTIDPKEKSGLTTGLDLGSLVKLEGTLQNPKAGINQAGVVNSAVSIGLGILTGGISIAAENAKSLANKSQPCKTALHSWSDIYPGN